MLFKKTVSLRITDRIVPISLQLYVLQMQIETTPKKDVILKYRKGCESVDLERNSKVIIYQHH